MNKFVKFFLQAFLITAFWANASFALVEDELVKATLSAENVQKPETHINYNYEDTDVVDIRLSVLEDIKNEKSLHEGQLVKFRVVRDVKYKGEVVIKRGTLATARVETIITNGMNGIPASVVFGDFNIEGIPWSKLTSNYEKYGFDMSLLVYPLKWALTILPPTGSFTNFIKGGHVRLKSTNIITIQYHPNWL